MDKLRFDYARVLISTSFLDLVITDAKVLIDGVIFYLKIVEEGGFRWGRMRVCRRMLSLNHRRI